MTRENARTLIDNEVKSFGTKEFTEGGSKEAAQNIRHLYDQISRAVNEIAILDKKQMQLVRNCVLEIQLTPERSRTSAILALATYINSCK